MPSSSALDQRLRDAVNDTLRPRAPGFLNSNGQNSSANAKYPYGTLEADDGDTDSAAFKYNHLPAGIGYGLTLIDTLSANAISPYGGEKKSHVPSPSPRRRVFLSFLRCGFLSSPLVRRSLSTLVPLLFLVLPFLSAVLLVNTLASPFLGSPSALLLSSSYGISSNNDARGRNPLSPKTVLRTLSASDLESMRKRKSAWEAREGRGELEDLRRMLPNFQLHADVEGSNVVHNHSVGNPCLHSMNLHRVAELITEGADPVPFSNVGVRRFIMESAYRVSALHFVAVGISPLSLHHSKSAGEGCFWSSSLGFSVPGDVHRAHPKEHHDMLYESVLYHCVLRWEEGQDEPGAHRGMGEGKRGGDGGMDEEGVASLLLGGSLLFVLDMESFTAYIEDPKFASKALLQVKTGTFHPLLRSLSLSFLTDDRTAQHHGHSQPSTIPRSSHSYSPSSLSPSSHRVHPSSLLSPLFRPKYKIGFCSYPMYREFNPQLVREWLRHAYHYLGVEHFTFNDAGSVDDEMMKVLLPYLRLGVLDIVDIRRQFAFPSKHNVLTLNACLMRMKKISEWVLFLDFDEFLYVHSPSHFVHYPGKNEGGGTSESEGGTTRQVLRQLLQGNEDKAWITFGSLWWSTQVCRRPTPPTSPFTSLYSLIQFFSPDHYWRHSSLYDLLSPAHSPSPESSSSSVSQRKSSLKMTRRKLLGEEERHGEGGGEIGSDGLGERGREEAAGDKENGSVSLDERGGRRERGKEGEQRVEEAGQKREDEEGHPRETDSVGLEGSNGESSREQDGNEGLLSNRLDENKGDKGRVEEGDFIIEKAEKGKEGRDEEGTEQKYNEKTEDSNEERTEERTEERGGKVENVEEGLEKEGKRLRITRNQETEDLEAKATQAQSFSSPPPPIPSRVRSYLDLMRFHWPKIYCEDQGFERSKCLSYHGHRKFIVNAGRTWAVQVHRVVDPIDKGLDLDTSIAHINHFQSLQTKSLKICEQAMVPDLSHPDWWVEDSFLADVSNSLMHF